MPARDTALRGVPERSLAAVLLTVLAGALDGTLTLAEGRRLAPDQALVAVRGRDEAGLDRLLAAQHDAASPEHRRWLTPAEFGRRFGAAPRDLKRVERWLRERGCRVKRFTGRQQLACVGATPGTPPADVAPLVADVLDPAVAPAPVFRLALGGAPQSLTPGGLFYFSPQEYAAYFGFDALHAAGIDGRGQRIGIVGFSTVDATGIAAFRSAFGLPPLELEQIGSQGDFGRTMESRVESILDVSWAGAVAPAAAIVLAVSSRILVDALAYLVDRPDVDVISLSVVLIPSREANPLIRQAVRLFRQASALGKTVLIASGDFGPLLTIQPRKRGVDPFAASPFVTAVGGTTPQAGDPLDASSYGGEVVWSEGESGSGGGRSKSNRPRWQRGSATRTVPDVSLPAAAVYPLWLGGTLVCCVGGTSAGAPAWAGLVAMLNQQRGTRMGLLNPALYDLGRAQARGGTAVFHDIVQGSSTTTLARGFPAKPGYDLATGWGSPDGRPFFATFP